MINILILNGILSIFLYFVFKIFRFKSSNISLLIMLVLPFIGMIIALILVIMTDVFKIKNNESLFYQNEDTNVVSLLLRKADLKNRKDLVALEEALILNENHTKRNLVINTLKVETFNYLEQLLDVLKDKDSETKHYAASALIEIKRKLLSNLQQYEHKYLLDGSNVIIINDYLEILEKCIYSKIMDNITNQDLINKYLNVLRNSIELLESNEQYYKKYITLNIELKHYDEALQYTKEYQTRFPNSIEPYYLLLNIYYELKDKDLFSLTINEIRQSNLKLNNEKLEILRFWMEGDNNV